MGEAPDSRLYGVDEVLAVCLQDRAFYEESGGGVTISGGEPFVQWRFTVSLLEKLRQNGIHTAVETAGHVAPDLFCAAIADADLLLFDIKHHDEKRHREGTGIANGVILHNLAHCMAIGKDVLPRIPVIPGYNDAIQDAEGFADLLQHMGETAVQLLPFHQLGDKKYDLLGRSYAFKEKKPLYEKDLTAYRDAFLQKGIRAFF